MTKVKVEFFKYTGKFYTSFEYESDIPAFDMLNLVKEVKNKPLFIKEMSFTIEADQGEKGWNKWLF